MQKLKERVSFSVDPDLMLGLRDFAQEGKESMSSIVGRAIEREISGVVEDDPALHQVRLKFFSRVPCGPMSEAASEAGDYVVNEDVADEMGLNSGDFVVMAHGESMMGPEMSKGDIIDGDYLFFRAVPEGRPPRTGSIVAAQAITADGVALATIKFWNNDTPPFLSDGQGARVDLPKDIEELKPVGVLRGLIRIY